MTKKEFYETIITLNLDSEITSYAENELAKMEDQKLKRKAKPSKTQIENEPIIDSILEVLRTSGKALTAADVAGFCEISTQKASSLLVKLADAGEVEKSEVKVKGRAVKTYTFIRKDKVDSIAEAETETDNDSAAE